VPRSGVTVLAQLTAGSFGTGWAYYAADIADTLVLARAANASFGGLPALMSLLSADRLPCLPGPAGSPLRHRPLPQPGHLPPDSGCRHGGGLAFTAGSWDPGST
jgi:hypothetical protein